MSWNYRVVRKDYEGEALYGIHEVYYNTAEDGTEEPVACSINPVEVFAEDLEGLQWVIDEMRSALEKPVIDYDGLKKKKTEGLRELTRETEELGGYEKEFQKLSED